MVIQFKEDSPSANKLRRFSSGDGAQLSQGSFGANDVIEEMKHPDLRNERESHSKVLPPIQLQMSGKLGSKLTKNKSLGDSMTQD